MKEQRGSHKWKFSEETGSDNTVSEIHIEGKWTYRRNNWLGDIDTVGS